MKRPFKDIRPFGPVYSSSSPQLTARGLVLKLGLNIGNADKEYFNMSVQEKESIMEHWIKQQIGERVDVKISHSNTYVILNKSKASWSSLKANVNNIKDVLDNNDIETHTIDIVENPVIAEPI